MYMPQPPLTPPGGDSETLSLFKLSSSAPAELEPQPSAPKGRGRPVAPALLPLPLGEDGGEGSRTSLRHVP